MAITGRVHHQLVEALVDAFSVQQLRMMLRHRLDVALDSIALGADYNEIAFKVIDNADSYGWIEKLVQAARESNPGNEKLLVVAQTLGLAPATPPELERVIRESSSFIDVARWRSQLGRLEAQVCKIELNMTGARVQSGTGFLIGPGLVMTNYHVVEPVIVGQNAMPSDLVVRFDFKQSANGTVISPGLEYKLSEDWLVDFSPPNEFDCVPMQPDLAPRRDELDFAVLRMSDSPGLDNVGANAEPGSPMRGRIKMPSAPVNLSVDCALSILQHPRGQPLKLAFDSNSLISINQNGTRITYRTNTEPGSSGAPVFDVNWNLVALHHCGDAQDYPPRFNEGIPMSTIYGMLVDRGHGLLFHEPDGSPHGQVA